MSSSEIESCDGCGASIYPEHLADEKAGLADGKLLCPHCLAEYRQTHHTGEQRLAGGATMKAPGEGEVLETLEVVEDEGERTTSIRAIGADTLAGAAAAAVDDVNYQRPLNPDSPAATRCRTFHAKLNDGAVAYMNRQINEWADGDPTVTIKYASSTIGVWEGKKADPHLIVTVLY